MFHTLEASTPTLYKEPYHANWGSLFDLVCIVPAANILANRRSQHRGKVSTSEQCCLHQSQQKTKVDRHVEMRGTTSRRPRSCAYHGGDSCLSEVSGDMTCTTRVSHACTSIMLFVHIVAHRVRVSLQVLCTKAADQNQERSPSRREADLKSDSLTRCN